MPVAMLILLDETGVWSGLAKLKPIAAAEINNLPCLELHFIHWRVTAFRCRR